MSRILASAWASTAETLAMMPTRSLPMTVTMMRWEFLDMVTLTGCRICSVHVTWGDIEGRYRGKYISVRQADVDSILPEKPRSRQQCRVLDPVPRGQEIGVQPGLRGAGFGFPVVTPLHDRRQRHENGFGAAARLQAEQCAAVVDQIEFDVTTAPVSLEIAFGFAEGQISAALDDRRVGVDQVVADAAHEREAGVEVGLRQVVEEDAANSTRFPAMLEIEILVAPFLEPGMGLRAERLQRFAARAMKVHRVFLESIIRRQVHAAAEPGNGLGPDFFRHEVAHVHVHRGHIRVARMQDQGHAHGLERPASEVGPCGSGRRRQGLAGHMREVDAPALKYAAVFYQAADAATTF